MKARFALPWLCLLATATGFAAPEVIPNDARHASYVRLLPAIPGEAFAGAGQRQVVRLLAKRATPPVTPDDIVPEKEIAEVIFRTTPVNRPGTFGTVDFLALWKTARLKDIVGTAEISLAPDLGFLILKDGKTLPFDLYGGTALRLFGFLFSKP